MKVYVVFEYTGDYKVKEIVQIRAEKGAAENWIEAEIERRLYNKEIGPFNVEETREMFEIEEYEVV